MASIIASGQVAQPALIRVSLCLEQPVPNTREIYDDSWGGGSSGNKNGGHAFLFVTQIDANTGVEKRLTFGFYPVTKPTGNEETIGSFYSENINTLYNVSVTWDMSAAQFVDFKSYFSIHSPFYQVGYNNCTTPSIGAIEKALGITLPKTDGHLPLLGEIDTNPGDLGEDLKTNSVGGALQYTADGSYLNPPLNKCQ